MSNHRRQRKVTHLDAIRMAPDPDVVRVLTDLLRRAKRGDVRGVAVAVSLDRGCDGSVYALGDTSIDSLNLALDRLKVRLLAIGEAE